MRKNKLLVSIIVLLLLTSCQSVGNSDYIEQYRSEASDLDHFIEKAAYVSTDQKPSYSHYHLAAKIQLKETNDGIKQLSYSLTMQHDKEHIKDITMSFTLHPDLAEKLGIHSLQNGVFATTLSNQQLWNVQITKEDDTLTLINPIGLAAMKVDTRMLALYRLMYVKLTYTIGEEHKTEYYKIEATPSQEVETYLKSHI